MSKSNCPTVSAYNRTYYAERAEKMRERSSAWRKANRERMLAYKRARYAENAERLREEARTYRESNPESVRAAKAATRAKHPQAHADLEAQRRARLRGSSTIEKVDRDAIIARDGGVCHLCGELVLVDVTLDHIVPLARGGDHTAANLAVAHRSCNSRKWIHPLNSSGVNA